MITNEEKGFLEQVPEPKVTAKPSVISGDVLLFKPFVDARSEFENVTKEFSGVSKNFCAKHSSVESFADAATDFAYSVGNLAENSGQGIITSKYSYGATGAEEVCSGHVAQWKEQLSNSEVDAGSKLESETNIQPCPHVFGARTNSKTVEKKENKSQARSLDKATLQLKEIVNVMGNSLFKSLHFGVEND